MKIRRFSKLIHSVEYKIEGVFAILLRMAIVTVYNLTLMNVIAHVNKESRALKVIKY